MKLDGRHAGNSPLAVLSRLSGEIAYAQKRLCLRYDPQSQKWLEKAANCVEEAMGRLEEND